MARDNLFLGMARGSIGDVTFYRAEGQQLSRVRNRRPRNPKTPAQLYQRAIMATVVKAYQAGKAIFDHSFQGYSVGAGCQRQFLKLNAKLLRQIVATDINSHLPTDEQRARVVAPGTNTAVANPFIISRGSYQQSLWVYDDASYGFALPLPDSDETVAHYVQRVGLIEGDIYTFIVFAELAQEAYVPTFTDDSVAFLKYCNFGWVRCIVKSGLSDVSDEASTLSQIFDFQTSGGDFSTDVSNITRVAIGGLVTLSSLLTSNPEGYLMTGGLGLIRSRFDQDLRSDSELKMIYGSDAEDLFGIASEYILDAWQSGTTPVGDSELILEGGDA